MSEKPELTLDIRPTKRATRAGPALARRVREVLLAFGGEAHRTIVIEQVARSLGYDPRRIPPDLKSSLIQCFEENWRDERRRAALGFHLPFGEGSHRWSVRAESIAIH
jgi:hypothetical protein